MKRLEKLCDGNGRPISFPMVRPTDWEFEHKVAACEIWRTLNHTAGKHMKDLHAAEETEYWRNRGDRVFFLSRPVKDQPWASPLEELTTRRHYHQHSQEDIPLSQRIRFHLQSAADESNPPPVNVFKAFRNNFTSEGLMRRPLTCRDIHYVLASVSRQAEDPVKGPPTIVSDLKETVQKDLRGAYLWLVANASQPDDVIQPWQWGQDAMHLLKSCQRAMRDLANLEKEATRSASLYSQSGPNMELEEGVASMAHCIAMTAIQEDEELFDKFVDSFIWNEMEKLVYEYHAYQTKEIHPVRILALVMALREGFTLLDAEEVLDIKAFQCIATTCLEQQWTYVSICKAMDQLTDLVIGSRKQRLDTWEGNIILGDLIDLIELMGSFRLTELICQPVSDFWKQQDSWFRFRERMLEHAGSDLEEPIEHRIARLTNNIGLSELQIVLPYLRLSEKGTEAEYIPSGKVASI